MLVQPKGTRRHVFVGRGYVLTMAMLLAAALATYEIDGGFGPFHFMALVSAVTLAGGWPLAGSGGTLPKPSVHSYFMVWSYVGLVAAGVSQFANRTLPDAGFLPVLAASAVTVGIAFVVIRRWMPKEISRALAD